MDNNKIEITLKKKKKYTAVFLDEFRALQLFITKNIILYLCERTRYINKKKEPFDKIYDRVPTHIGLLHTCVPACVSNIFS